jgi:hypothetical protein
MSESAGPGRSFEELLNRPTGEFADEVVLRERVSVWMSHLEGKPEAYSTFREIGTTGNSSKSCGVTSLLDISGTFYTGANGTAEFLLTDFWCNEWFDFAGRHAFEYPVIFIATPQTNAPIFLTSLQVLVAHQNVAVPGPVNDIKLTVFSWDTNGNPTGNVVFDWRCSAPMSWKSIFDPRTRDHHSEPNS